jgi:hypothetical protein
MTMLEDLAKVEEKKSLGTSYQQARQLMRLRYAWRHAGWRLPRLLSKSFGIDKVQE